jgi:hypothetical protein
MSQSTLVPRLALAAMGLLLGLGAGEALARWLGPSFQVVFRDSIVATEDPALGYELRPLARDGKNRINAAGLRDREVAIEKPPGTWRIAAIGDSITYGSGVSRDGAYGEQLEELLAAARVEGQPRVEVLNFGVPGYNVTQIVERLRRRGLAFDPDAVVYGYSLNDPQAFSIEAEALRRLAPDDGRTGEPGFVRRFLSRSHLVLLVRRVLHDRRSQQALRDEMPNDPAYEAAKTGSSVRYFEALHAEGEPSERLQSGLDALAALAAERRLPVLVLLFPLFGTSFGDSPGALAPVHEKLVTAMRARGFAVVDLLPIYTAASRALGRDFAVDFMHPDGVGQRVAAWTVFAWMCENGWPAPDALACSTPPATPLDRSIADAIAAAR